MGGERPPADVESRDGEQLGVSRVTLETGERASWWGSSYFQCNLVREAITVEQIGKENSVTTPLAPS